MGVIVLGSINVDIVSRVTALPLPGETVPGGPLQVLLGGKGANQAVAAALSGAETRMLACIGDQSFGLPLKDMMEGYGVDMTHVATLDGPSGAALIGVDDSAENSIIVSPGANGRAGEATFPAPDANDHVLAQLELPTDVVLSYFQRAKSLGATTVLNTAPALDIPDALFDLSDILILNETELATYAGDGPPADQAARLRRRDDQIIIATLGADGLVALVGDTTRALPARRADPLDTTGAGDCFSGALTARLAAGEAIWDALAYAQAAAAISVTRPGAAGSMPTRAEVLQALASDQS